MDLPKNNFKAALKNGQQQYGLWVTIPDSTVVEVLAGCGYDWLVLDTEHTAADAGAVLPMLQTAAAYPTNCVVRPGWSDAVEIKRMLDCGAQTILVPYVQNAEEAAAAVAAVRYPPRGVRGVASITRAARFGAIENYTQRADDEICLLVQVETTQALENLDEIMAVDGIDGIFFGPADLAASMGHPGQTGHPEVVNTIRDAIKRVRAAGIPPGTLSRDQAFLHDMADAGAQFIALDLDAAILRQGAIELLNGWRS
jgi:4-hydroxy-2-oxoheptanedioate aldolase